ncbi:DmpA family aminopeptidase [Lacihabitans soyangensis]|uniref:S58 family peptidase n=1 Tax=Lacihabitans soyangensis TaxID=869394 RepID=A0AAE3KVL9_9BACT|nr:P1 family peptidase [Lacihabitans soyangensis]MCP9761380.1 S58 family peptidase [Lacihabitans soyangensis]
MRFLLLSFLLILQIPSFSQKPRPRELGIEFGILKTGNLNAITDVPGVKVGHFTLHQGTDIHTGVTAILPIEENIFQNKVPAAIYIGNGFGKLAGYTQVEELGNIETPILLTNTMVVSTAIDALIDFTIQNPENKTVKSVNAVVGETNDGGLNDIRARVLTKENMLEAIASANSGKVAEGNVGAGTGTMSLGFKGGIGTSSRILPISKGGYTVGVLVQSNFGGVLQIGGKPIGQLLGNYKFKNIDKEYEEDGSCMMVVITDAPLNAKNLKRLAARAMLGLSRTGGMAANGSGDYVIALSTAKDLRIAHDSKEMYETFKVLRNNDLDLLFQGVVEATEEAIINSLFAAEDLQGFNGYKAEALPIKTVMELLKK